MPCPIHVHRYDPDTIVYSVPMSIDTDLGLSFLSTAAANVANSVCDANQPAPATTEPPPRCEPGVADCHRCGDPDTRIGCILGLCLILVAVVCVCVCVCGGGWRWAPGMCSCRGLDVDHWWWWWWYVCGGVCVGVSLCVGESVCGVAVGVGHLACALDLGLMSTIGGGGGMCVVCVGGSLCVWWRLALGTWHVLLTWA